MGHSAPIEDPLLQTPSFTLAQLAGRLDLGQVFRHLAVSWNPEHRVFRALVIKLLDSVRDRSNVDAQAPLERR
eukprot:8132594-Pyramimonas_sp.AAC.1